MGTGFDHPEVGEVMDDATAVGVEKHDFLAGLELGWGAWHRPSMPYNQEIRNRGLNPRRSIS